MNFLTTTGLKLAGMSDDTVAKIQEALPATAGLIQLYKDNAVLIQQAADLEAKAEPMIKAAMAEILPAAEGVVSFLQDR